MTEKERFEIKGYFKMEGGKLVPFSLQITRDILTISARIKEDREPYPESLTIIKSIDEFLHKATPHVPSEECEQPEKIVFFLKWVPK
jgi:hypothetical protein